MTDVAFLGPWVRRFLLEYLVSERNLARNTQAQLPRHALPAASVCRQKRAERDRPTHRDRRVRGYGAALPS